MAEAKHAPGPWTKRDMINYFDIMCGPYVVASVPLCGAGPYGGRNGGTPIARLIVAAPDLLAACVEFLPILERQLESVNPGGIASESQAIQYATARVERMRAAITKATGESDVR